MNTLEGTVAIVIAIVLIVVAVYFAWRQRLTLQMLDADEKLRIEQHRYLYKQSVRRLIGSFLLLLLAAMMIGSLFLDYQLLRTPLDELPPAEQAAAKQSVRFVSIYWMTFLLLLMSVMALAIFDLWATARHAMQQQKQLFREHQEMLEAELAEQRHRRAEMN